MSFLFDLPRASSIHTAITLCWSAEFVYQRLAHKRSSHVEPCVSAKVWCDQQRNLIRSPYSRSVVSTQAGKSVWDFEHPWSHTLGSCCENTKQGIPVPFSRELAVRSFSVQVASLSSARAVSSTACSPVPVRIHATACVLARSSLCEPRYAQRFVSK